jgi:hypothetical protein
MRWGGEIPPRRLLLEYRVLSELDSEASEESLKWLFHPYSVPNKRPRRDVPKYKRAYFYPVHGASCEKEAQFMEASDDVTQCRSDGVRNYLRETS